MKRVGFLIEKIADIDNLRLAFWKASKGKRHGTSVLNYQRELNTNLLNLSHQILENELDIGKYHFFKIKDPKERLICASPFHEQVLHHALMNICHPYFERFQIDNSYACRKDKGTYAAIKKAKQFSKKYPCFLKLDVKKFFGSIHHDVLKEQLRRLFKDKILLSIFVQLIDSYENKANRGLPIGNLTSQYFANHFLASLDHFIQTQLQIKGYIRYMDDMIVWHQDKDYLKKCRNTIKKFVEQELQGELKPALLNYSDRGLPFLGYKIFPTHTHLTQRSKLRYIRKLKYIEQQYHNGNWTESQCQQKILPLLAFINHADTENFKKSVFLNHRSIFG